MSRGDKHSRNDIFLFESETTFSHSTAILIFIGAKSGPFDITFFSVKNDEIFIFDEIFDIDVGEFLLNNGCTA